MIRDKNISKTSPKDNVFVKKNWGDRQQGSFDQAVIITYFNILKICNF